MHANLRSGLRVSKIVEHTIFVSYIYFQSLLTCTQEDSKYKLLFFKMYTIKRKHYLPVGKFSKQKNLRKLTLSLNSLNNFLHTQLL